MSFPPGFNFHNVDGLWLLSVKLRVISVAPLELWTSYLRAWDSHCFLEPAESSVCISAASACQQALIGAIKAAGHSRAAMGRWGRQLSSTAMWCNCNMTQANRWLPGCGQAVLGSGGTPFSSRMCLMEEQHSPLHTEPWSRHRALQL